MLFIKHNIIHHCIYAVNIYLSRNESDTDYPVTYRQTTYGKDFCKLFIIFCFLFLEAKYRSKIYRTFPPECSETKTKVLHYFENLDKEFYVKVSIHLHYSRRLLNHFINKSYTMNEKISEKKVGTVMKKRTFIFVLFSKIPLRNFGKICKKPL
jgi:hypothetical protein